MPRLSHAALDADSIIHVVWGGGGGKVRTRPYGSMLAWRVNVR